MKMQLLTHADAQLETCESINTFVRQFVAKVMDGDGDMKFQNRIAVPDVGRLNERYKLWLIDSDLDVDMDIQAVLFPLGVDFNDLEYLVNLFLTKELVGGFKDDPSDAVLTETFGWDLSEFEKGLWLTVRTMNVRPGTDLSVNAMDMDVGKLFLFVGSQGLDLPIHRAVFEGLDVQRSAKHLH